MALITISRQEGSLSRDIASSLAEKLGWLYIDRNVIKKALTDYNVDALTIEKYDEKKPSLLDSFSLENEKYFNYFKLYFYEKALEKKGCILLGRGGSFILKNVPGVLRVRIVAPEQSRIARVMERENCNEKKAKEIVSHKDKSRESFHKFYFNDDWNSPESYDIVFNTDYISSDTVYDMINGALARLLEKDTESSFRKHLNNMLLAQKIIIQILYTEQIPVHLFEVYVEDGTASLAGTVESESLIKKCGEAAKLAGIDSVDNKLVFVSQYPPII